MPLETNLNIAPYYDDYDESKGYHRILFRPGVSVQARELTQLQTILQTQIERFGSNILKSGTILRGCDFNYSLVDYVKLNDVQVDGIAVSVGRYANALVINETSNLHSYVVNQIAGFESTDPDLNTIYISYINSGTNDEKFYAENDTLKLFNVLRRVERVNVLSGGTLYSNSDTVQFISNTGSGAFAAVTTYANGTIAAVTMTSFGSGYTDTPTANVVTSSGTGASLSPQIYIGEVTVANTSVTSNAVGRGFRIKCTDGAIYQKGNFILVDTQELIAEKYYKYVSNSVIGFYTDESIVNSNIDSTLLDNSQGTTNFNAPGADRLKLTPRLVKLTPEESQANNDFFPIIEFQDGKVIKDNFPTAFNSIDKTLSKRTFEESGDYVLRPIPMTTQPIEGNTTHFEVLVSPGTAYVKGNRFELKNGFVLESRKATDTSTIDNQSINTSFGNYVVIKELYGTLTIKEGDTVSLRDTAATDVSDAVNSGAVPSTPGATIGSARVRSLEYKSGIVGSGSCEYRLYLFDVRMSKGKAFRLTRSISINGVVVADVVLTGNRAVLQDVIQDRMVFPVGVQAIKELTNEEFRFLTSTNGTFESVGSDVLLFSGGNTLPYGAGALSDSLKSDLIITPTESFRYSANNSGTVTVSSSSVNVVGTTTSFLTEYSIGDYITVSNGTSFSPPKLITSVVNNTFLTVNVAFSAAEAATTNNHTTAFPAYVPIDFTKYSRDITQNANNSLTIDLAAGINTTADFVIVHELKESAPLPRAKTVKSPVYVKLSTDSVSARNRGPWCLGIPDVYKIDSVYINSSNSYSESGTNQASKFLLRSGQTDSMYGLSYLRLRPGSGISLSNTDCLLVKLKAFEHSSGSYISAESYPVDDTNTDFDTNITTQQIPVFISPVSGDAISLRDAVDFRPIVSPTANIAANTAASATVDPATTETLTSGDKYFPSLRASFEATIEAYLYRIDKLAIDTAGVVRIIEGIPSFNPLPPPDETSSMSIAVITVAPYPSLSAVEAANDSRPDLANEIVLTQVPRYTMSDINQLEERIRRLEYYSLFNTLESDTKNLTITSESNTALERFKNGFFVDPFTNYSISNLNDEEFAALIDAEDQRLSPQKDIETIDLAFSNTLSSNVVLENEIVILQHGERTLISQDYATRERTLVQNAWRYAGRMVVYPNFDNSFDKKYLGTKTATVDIAGPMTSLVNALNQVPAIKNTRTTTVKQSDPAQVTSKTSTRSGRVETITTKYSQNVTTTKTTKTSKIKVPPTSSTTYDLGTYVTDVQISQWIRGQQITLYATGLRPGAKHYIFFDNKNVTDLCVEAKPLKAVGLTTKTASRKRVRRKVRPRRKKTKVSKTLPTQVTPPTTFFKPDANGDLTVIFYCPDKTFNQGEKEIMIIDVDNINSFDAATSFCKGQFTSFALRGATQSAAVSVRSFENTSGTGTVKGKGGFSYETSTKVDVSKTKRTWTEVQCIMHTDPLSQTFTVQSGQGGEVFYLTAIDVYFKQKDDAQTVTLELREVDENGHPIPTILPFSTVIKQANEVFVSNNASLPTKFEFSSPIPVNIDKDYAIVLAPGSMSPDYRIWTAKTGDPDVTVPTLFTRQSFALGTLFFSTSNRVFTPIQDEDLKFEVYRAHMSRTRGSVVLTNDDTEYLAITNVVGQFVQGEDVAQIGNTYLNTTITTDPDNDNTVILTSTSISSGLVEDDKILIVYGSNQQLGTANVQVVGTTVSNSTATTTTFESDYAIGDFVRIGTEIRQIVSISSNTSMEIDAALNIANTDTAHWQVTPIFDVLRLESANSTAIVVDKPPQLTVNSTVRASLQKVVGGEVKFFDESEGKLHIGDSNAANSTFKIFTSNSTYLATLVGENSEATARVANVENVTFHAFTPMINKVIPPGTSASLRLGLTRPSGAVVNKDYQFDGKNNLDINGIAVVKSKSNEISGTTITKTLRASINLTTQYTDTSPIIDIDPCSLMVEKYLINNSSADEETRYGNATSKYISKRIELADGLDAEDIKLYITAYKPEGTEIKVYAKILNSADSDEFNEKAWSELRQITADSLVSSTSDQEDFKEYEYGFKFSPATTRLTGTIDTYGNTTVEGFSTSFTSDLTANDIVKIVYSASETDYDIIPVSSITDANTLVLTANASQTASGAYIEKVTIPEEAFKNARNENIVRYYDENRATYDTYKYLAIKIVMLSDTEYVVPFVDDVRCIACSV